MIVRYFWVKRVFDLLIVIPSLIILSPVFVLAGIAVKFSSLGPVFFSQIRGGRNGKPFMTFKFRSMVINDEDPALLGRIDGTNTLVTPVGRIIRRLKIDELPQLWNVLRGEMSIVGPRPTLLEQINSYSEEERGRLVVLPGLTGWAQVNGNIELSWDERIVLDLWYIRHWSLWLDVKIIWLTFAVILLGERPNKEALDEANIRRSS